VSAKEEIYRLLVESVHPGSVWMPRSGVSILSVGPVISVVALSEDESLVRLRTLRPDVGSFGGTGEIFCIDLHTLHAIYFKQR
jgi:hypothetical protein